MLLGLAQLSLTASGLQDDTSLTTTTTTSSIYEEFQEQQSSIDVNIILTTVYLAIFLIGVIGNVCNCLVIADSRNKYMKTATNYYLFSLSVSDLLLLIFGLPHDLVNLWHPSPYLFNQFVCISRGWISEASTYASVLVIVAFTVERYLAICHPLKAHTLSRLSRSIKIIIFIWLLASTCALIVVMQYGVIMIKERLPNGQEISTAQCTTISRNETIFELSVLIFFIIPMAVITILYVNLGCQLSRKTIIIKQKSRRKEEPLQYTLSSASGQNNSRSEMYQAGNRSSSAQHECLLAENTCANSISLRDHRLQSGPGRTSSVSRPSSPELVLGATNGDDCDNCGKCSIWKPEVGSTDRKQRPQPAESKWKFAAVRNWLYRKFWYVKPSNENEAQAGEGGDNNLAFNNTQLMVNSVEQLQSIRVSPLPSPSRSLSSVSATSASSPCNKGEFSNDASKLATRLSPSFIPKEGQVTSNEIELAAKEQQSGGLICSEGPFGRRLDCDSNSAIGAHSGAKLGLSSQESPSQVSSGECCPALEGEADDGNTGCGGLRQQDGANQITGCNLNKQQRSGGSNFHQVAAITAATATADATRSKHLAGGNKDSLAATAADDSNKYEQAHNRHSDQKEGMLEAQGGLTCDAGGANWAAKQSQARPQNLMVPERRSRGSSNTFQQAPASSIGSPPAPSTHKIQPIALHSTANKANMQSVIKMLASVVVMFFICWAPFHAQRLMAVYVTEPTSQQEFIYSLLNHISGISYYISAVVNPILYSLFSVKFRQAFRDTFKSLKICSSSAT